MAKKKKKGKKDARGYVQNNQQSSSKSNNSINKKSAEAGVTSRTHDGLKNLLGTLESNPQGTTLTSAALVTQKTTAVAKSSVPVDRKKFDSNFAVIVDRLAQENLGFREDQIEKVVTALGYEMTTLEKALDWLCLNIPTLELPPLFTDGRLRDSLSITTTSADGQSSLTVLKMVAPSKKDGGEAQQQQTEEQQSSLLLGGQKNEGEGEAEKKKAQQKQIKAQIQKEEEEEAAARKAWLLQQYEFEEEEEENVTSCGDDDIAKDEEQSLNKTNSAKTGGGEESTPSPESTVLPSLSPKELQLAEKEKELQLLEADLGNDANNYMRSKQELKQLRIDAKRLRQQVAGLRKKVEHEKVKAQREQQEQEKEEEEEDPELVAERELMTEEGEEEGGGGFFDIFNSPSPAQVPSQKPPEQEGADEDEATAPTTHVQMDFTIPKDWTGTTPQKTLDEICKKQKLPKPKYFKLPKNSGYRLTAALQKKGATKEWRAEKNDFVTGTSLQDYLAVQALYELDPTLPLYRVFPPAFRELWLSWLQQVQQEKEDAANAVDTAKRERLELLLSLLPPVEETNNAKSSSATSAAVPSIFTTKTAAAENIHKDDFVVPVTEDEEEDWEAQVTKDEEDREAQESKQGEVSKSTKSVSARGGKIREEFVRRQKSAEYRAMLNVRNSLPMSSFRQEVLETVEKNSVMILCAETGAGKTTQCPQYLLEEAILDGYGDLAQIICTQPRRVAATSVAERVAEEMCEQKVGGMVGYQIRMEAKRSKETKLLFCTTGVVLRRLQDDSTLKGVTHVIVDEVHERQQQTDVLLVALRQLLHGRRPDLKIILMSATLDANLFCSFFNDAPLVSVPGRTFPVSTYFLEDLIDATDHIIEEGSRFAIRETYYNEKASLWVTNRGGEKRKEVVDLVSQTDVSDVSDLFPGYKMSTRRSMDRVNEEVINFDLIEDTLNLLLDNSERNSSLLPPDGADLSKGSILVFLPGLGEIRSLTERLQASRSLGDNRRFEIIPMHSTLSSRDQRRAFIPSKAGCRKIILSTNIAETSVTIPDVVCVLDSGRVREVRRNKRTSTSILVTDWCSKASAKQRAGRAGRVQPGLCLKLYSSITSDRVMKPTSEPELKRVPLEEVCLSILASGFATSCREFLSQAPQPPTNDSIQAALEVLFDVGAIELIEDDTVERLTPLGHHLAKLPVDARLGKMLIFGSLFKCIDKALTIAAGLSSQSPFATFVRDANVAKAKQRAFADPNSDFLTLCNVWEAYSEAVATSASAGRKFCHANYLNHVALREIRDARMQFFDLLCNVGFLDRGQFMNQNSRIDSDDLRRSVFNENSDKPELVHAVICAGLYPNVANIEQGVGTRDYVMTHKNERLYFHSSSVNSSKKKFSAPSESWVVFHEKFGTVNRVSVSTTCFVHPFALLLLGGSVTVRHTERLVLIDDWIHIGMAAQVGVIMRELRKQIDSLLTRLIEDTGSKPVVNQDGVIEGIVNLLLS